MTASGINLDGALREGQDASLARLAGKLRDGASCC